MVGKVLPFLYERLEGTDAVAEIGIVSFDKQVGFPDAESLDADRLVWDLHRLEASQALDYEAKGTSTAPHKMVQSSVSE